VLFVSQAARLASALRRTKPTGAGTPFGESRSRFVRKGLKGREAVASKSKKPCMVFLILT
jgi:hypothetical protein